ncbi:NAD(P)-dependent alcohol dehydrogenase [Pseudarthrobacter sp. MDT3-26]|uniref:NAD(P)-dependent alcohol dehydrogenase n=1 Tax=Pseudarthrobacter raffinosi TaxID=2953651 RepID=UPI00208EB5B9|nr:MULTISPECIES: NAD(P)-dependent alcohol dehydrogenase [unclassified Pseudarthrobacter]MCO4238201.1 NAD(P)-dependent alcohol dehydrogenase [Pseudarthrobacter sp. MDT3-28]MCO4264499.1 NAD(P)-dependent alcohol dehydrogenase [Pseudarthrobacter sp. MDT3-26]
MKAATYRRSGGPDVVSVEEIPQPPPRPGEVLIKVMASTLSAADYRARSRKVPAGLEALTALALGVFRPRTRVLGMDIAGVIDSVGQGVTAFRPGDEVIAMLGARFGGHAEYVSVPADGPIAAKPRNMGFEEAVTLIFGGLTAKNFLGLAAIKPGDTVLVNGASGAVGTAAIQLAKHLGAHVTAVCSGANKELVESLGADSFIDYTTDDFTEADTTYDVVMDCVGNAPFTKVEGSITPGGALLLVIADFKGLLGARGQSRRSGKLVTAGSLKLTYTADDVAFLVGLAEEGKYQAVIDRTYNLADVVEAHRFVDTGRKRGNVVLRVHQLQGQMPNH